MHEYGIPTRIRTDNGAPFAGNGLLGLSKLSLSWIKMGIVHERIQPGRPQQNGRHERMHRTLKEDTTKPPALTLRLQQKKFDRFRHMFNHERPHEEMDEDFFRVYFRDIELGELDVAELRFRSVRVMP
jgi:transposase InsO family protein